MQLMMALAFFLTHKSPVLFLTGSSAAIPGYVIAVLAWRGNLKSKCAALH
jgi:hypothetical protein